MKKQSEILLEEIIEYAEIVDKRDKEAATNQHQGERVVGQSWLVHHLNSLKRLLEDNR